MKLSELKEIAKIDIQDYIDFREKVKGDMNHHKWLGDFTIDEIKEKLESNSMKIWIYKRNAENAAQ